MMLLLDGAAQACTLPAPFVPPPLNAGDATMIAAADDVRAYLTALDDYATCVKSSIPTLPAGERREAIDRYNLSFALMQDAVTGYNAVLALREGNS
jgi:hypothetical protein